MNYKKIISILTASSVIFSVVALSGCSKNEDTSKTSSNTTTEKDKDQFLSVPFTEPRTLDPNAFADANSAIIISACQEGLARIQPENGVDKVIPAGAKSWEVSKDQLTWTFHLRDYSWSDGKKVTASQFVDSVRRLLNPKKGFEYAFFAFDIKNAEKFYNNQAKEEDIGIKAEDDNTLVITLEKPTPYFEKKLASPCLFPIRLDLINAGGENWETEFQKHVFCGPFKMTEWSRENTIVLEKNDKFWDASNVYLNKIDMKNAKEFSTQAQLFEGKQMDIIAAESEFIEKWKTQANKGNFKYLNYKRPVTQMLLLNTAGGPSGVMSNAKIRKALTLAIDRDEYINKVLGYNIPSYGLLPLGLTLGDKEFRNIYKEPIKEENEKLKNDADKLQSLFKEGLKELGKPTDNLKDINITLVTTGTTANQREIQTWWKQQYEKKLGITFTVQLLGDGKLVSAARKSGKFDMAFSAWGADFDDPITFLDCFVPPNGFAHMDTKFNNKEYNDLFKQLAGETDLNKRGEIYSKLEKIAIYDDPAIIPYCYNNVSYFSQNYVHDIYFPMFGPIYEFRWAYTSGRN